MKKSTTFSCLFLFLSGQDLPVGDGFKPGPVGDVLTHRLAADFDPGMRLELGFDTPGADAQLTGDAAP